MLGSSKKSKYKYINDFENSSDYLNYMYGQVKGLIECSSIDNYYNRNFTNSEKIIKRKYDNIKNVYVSMNTFFKYERTVEQLGLLNALYVDIDCYKINMTKEQVLLDLQDDYFGSKIPYPTFVIDSGRGLYLIWKINENNKALPRWKRVMDYLFENCKIFNADPTCKDASRIFRIPFSINSKSNTSVKIIDFNDVSYTLHEIIREYDIKPKKKTIENVWGKATKKMKQYASVIAEQNGIEIPNFNDYNATFKFISENKFNSNEKNKNKKDNIIYFNTSNKKPILKSMCDDVEQLMTSRQNENCKREIGLFLYRMWLCELTNNYEYSLSMTNLLNKKLKFPLDEKFVATRTKSAEKIIKSGKSYKYSKKRIIEILEITNEEMEKLSYLNIFRPHEAKKNRNRRAYLTRLKIEGKKTKSDTVKIRREKIAMEVASGKTKIEICNLLNISKRTYERDMVIIKKNNLIQKAVRILEKNINKTKNKTKKTIEIFADKNKKNRYNNSSMTATKIQPPYYIRTPLGVHRNSFFRLNICSIFFVLFFDFFNTA